MHKCNKTVYTPPSITFIICSYAEKVTTCIHTCTHDENYRMSTKISTIYTALSFQSVNTCTVEREEKHVYTTFVQFAFQGFNFPQFAARFVYRSINMHTALKSFFTPPPGTTLWKIKSISALCNRKWPQICKHKPTQTRSWLLHGMTQVF